MFHVKNARDRTLYVIVVSAMSVIVSLLVTALATGGKLGPDALTPAIVVPMAVAPPISLLVSGKMLQIHKLNQELLFLLEHDRMTSLLNRGAFFARIESSGERESTIMMLDIDHFKSINDTFGHSAGDQVIVAVARQLRDKMAEDGLAARIGGEEFAIYARHMSVEQARQRADAIRTAVAAQKITYDNAELGCTISIGVAPLCETAEIDEAMKSADLALYESKHKGRNRVTVFKDSHFETDTQSEQREP